MAGNNSYYTNFVHGSPASAAQPQYSTIGPAAYAGGYTTAIQTPYYSTTGQTTSYVEAQSPLVQYGAYGTPKSENMANAAAYSYIPLSTSVPSYSYPAAAATDTYTHQTNKYATGRYCQQATNNTTVPTKEQSGGQKSGHSSSSSWHTRKATSSYDTNTYSNQAAATTSSTYSGLDAAVYSAATNYYQQKITSTGQNQPGNSYQKRPSFNQFVNKSRFQRPPAKPSQLHYCDVCKISCVGARTYMDHLEGRNHKKKEAQSKAATDSTDSGDKTAPKTDTSSTTENSNVPASQRRLYCQLCDVACTGADTYAAHIRGAKHQKVLTLHNKLGKPIPELPTAEVTPTGAKVIVSKTPTGTTKVVGAPNINFVGGSQLHMLGSEAEKDSSVVEVTAAESTIDTDVVEMKDDDIQPVGLEYVEEGRNESGSAISFYCKLCECNFTDPLAKIMHTKGRRHRLNYKQKVDPSLIVDIKPYPYVKRLQKERFDRLRKQGMAGDNWRRPSIEDVYRQQVEELRYEKELLQWQLSQNDRFDTPSMMMTSFQPASRGESLNDRYVQAKHAIIYPNEADLVAVQMTVSDCEKALKLISDTFAESDVPPNNQAAGSTESTKESEKLKPETENTEKDDMAMLNRQLKGVMRVGALAKGLLLHGDLNLDLVVLCSDWPTKALVKKIMEVLPKLLSENSTEKYVVSAPGSSYITVVREIEPRTSCHISLTSPSVRDENLAIQTNKAEYLPRENCLQSLAALRHTKWFQAKANVLKSCVILIRVLKDLCERVPTWNPLHSWAIELLVEKVLSSNNAPVSPGTGLQLIFECISSGIFLPGGHGLLDPCEKIPTDAVQHLTLQEREDITNSAQHALRLIAFNQIFKVIAIDEFVNHSVPFTNKRPKTNNKGPDAGCEEKKFKTE